MKSELDDVPHTILIVDDEESIRFTLKAALQERYVVFTAADGAAALELIKTEHPALVFMDIKMPAMTGVEALEAIKAAGLSPVIWMLTGVDDLDVVVHTLQLGARGYLTKPLDMERIRNIIMDVFGETESSDKSWTVKK